MLQVINNFGPLSNAELLRRYGFVEMADNPHDCVEISVEDILQVNPTCSPCRWRTFCTLSVHGLPKCSMQDCTACLQ